MSTPRPTRLICLLALLGCAAASARVASASVRDAPAPAAADTGNVSPFDPGDHNSLIVRTAEAGRSIWVRGSYVGRSPVRVDHLPPGDSDVLVGDLPGSDGWFRPWSRSILLAGDRLDTLRVGPLQRLLLRSEPPGATVRLDGRGVGRTPLWMLVPGDRPMHVELVSLDGTRTELDYDGAGRPDSTLQVSIPGAAGAEEAPVSSRPTWGERARILLPAAAALAGVGGLLSRRIADRAYDSYESTLDRSIMQQKLDSARFYDRIAAGCWIGAEVLLAAATWSWVRGANAPLKLNVNPRGGASIGIDLGALSSRRPAQAALPDSGNMARR
jgi:hypothetical protein